MNLITAQSLLKVVTNLAPSRSAIAIDSGSVEGKLGKCVKVMGDGGGSRYELVDLGWDGNPITAPYSTAKLIQITTSQPYQPP